MEVVVAAGLDDSSEAAMRQDQRTAPRDCRLASGLDSRAERGDNAAHGEQLILVGQVQVG